MIFALLRHVSTAAILNPLRPEWKNLLFPFAFERSGRETCLRRAIRSKKCSVSILRSTLRNFRSAFFNRIGEMQAW